VRLPNPYRGLRGLPAEVWIIAATTLVNRAGMMALPFLVLYLTRHLHIEASLAGLTVSAYGFGGLLTATYAGRLADRLGPFTVMRWSLGLSGTLLLLIPLARHFAAIIALVFVWAVIAEAMRPATMSALSYAAPPERRKAAIALNRLAVNVGMSIGPAVGGFLAMVSFPLLFIIDGATSLAAAAVLAWLLRKRGSIARAHAELVTTAEREAVFSGAPVVWRDRKVLTFFASAIVINAVFAQNQGAMPLYIVRDLGYTEAFFGGLFVLNTLIIIAVEVPLNTAMAHWPNGKSNALAAVLVALGFGGLALAQTPLPIALTVVLWTFGEMIFYPTSTAHVADLAPRGRIGEYLGAFSATISLSFIVGPWFGVWLLDRFGAQVMWTIMLGIGLAAAWMSARSSSGPAHSPPSVA
jgi:predicted MFS family arabinose efflux permease